MLDTRRCFLKNLAGLSSSFLHFNHPHPCPYRAAGRPSVHLHLKQTQEIEKLAKQLKNYAKA